MHSNIKEIVEITSHKRFFGQGHWRNKVTEGRHDEAHHGAECIVETIGNRNGKNNQRKGATARKAIVPLQVVPLIAIPTTTYSTTNIGTFVD